MSNDPFEVKGQPEPEAGVVENVMRGHDMRKCQVLVVFNKRRSKAPDQPSRRYNFPTTVLAQDFINAVNPPLGLQLGSPKQLKAKRAKLLNLQYHLIDLYDITLQIVKMDASAPIGENTGGVNLTDDDVVEEFGEPTTTGDEAEVDTTTSDAADALKEALDGL